MREAYHGDDPFVFVSYAHADSEAVFPEIERLSQLGVRVWYDEGIEIGNDWPEEIGRALAACSLFIVFISPHSVMSKVVQNEINFALNRSKPLLAVYLEQTTLPVGLELRIGDVQALLKYAMQEEHYLRKLGRSLPSEIIQTVAVEQVTPCKRVAIAPRGPLTRAVCLQFHDGQRERNVCLLAGDRARLGKDRNNDFVLRVLPRSPENDLLSRQLSGSHAELVIDQETVRWRNADCANGTIVDGRTLGAKQETTLKNGSQIRPADVLPLAIDVFDGPHFDAPADFSAFRTFAVSGSDVPTGNGPINAVVLHREDTLAEAERYVLVNRGALLGRGPTCAVRIDHPTLSNRHARLFALYGGLWIEPVDESSIVIVDGQQLSTDELAVVVPGSTLTCGALTIRVSPRFQHSLGCIDPEQPPVGLP